MFITISGWVRKQCPYRDEVDEGTVVFTFEILRGDGPELHGLSEQLSTSERISHEDFTWALWTKWQPEGLVHVQTNWRTAGLEVRVDVPDRPR